MNRHNLTAAITFAGMLASSTGLVSAQSLDEELVSLATGHPLVQSERANLRNLEARIDGGDGAFLPTVALYGDTGPEYVDNPSRRSSDLDSSHLRREKFTFTVTHNLFNGYRDTNDLKSRKAIYQGDEQTLNETTRDEMLRGILAYLDVLKYSEMVKLSKDREKTIAMQMNLENERVERGSGIAVDVLEAKSRLRKAKEKTVSNIQSLEGAEATFEHAPHILTMKDVVPPFELLPDTVEDALSLALKKRGSILADSYNKKAYELSAEAERGGYYPTVDLVGSYDFEDDVSATRGIAHTGSIIVQANWEIFSGFKTRALIAENAELASSYDGLMRNKRRIAEEEVMDTWSELMRTQERHDLLTSAVTIAEEVFDARKKLRESGKETVINVLDAESQVYDAQISLIDMDYQSRGAVFKVLAAAGLLTLEELGL